MLCSVCAGVLSEHISLLGYARRPHPRRNWAQVNAGRGKPRPYRCQEIAEALSHGGGTRTEAIPAARAA